MPPVSPGLLLLLALLASTQTCLAAFYFDRQLEYIDVNLDQVSNKFIRTVTVHFLSVCELSGCNPPRGGQDYRMGISSEDEGKGQGAPNLNHTKMSATLHRVRFFSATGRRYTLYTSGWGSWSPMFEYRQSPALWQTATFELEIKKSGLIALKPGEYLSVFLVGLDSEATNFRDTLEIRLRKKDNRTVKISKLSDVTLTTRNNSSAKAKTMLFCMYVSDGGDYSLTAHGKNDAPNGRFKLSNGHETLAYMMNFKTTRSGWVKNISPGQILEGNGSDDDDCKGATNAKLAIYLDETPSGSGRFMDTVTLTVSPK